MKSESQPADPTSLLDAESARRGLGGYWLLSALLAMIGVAVLPLDPMLGSPNSLEAIPGDLERVVTLSEIFAHGFGIAIVGIGIWVLSSSHRKLIPRIVMCAIWPCLLYTSPSPRDRG